MTTNQQILKETVDSVYGDSFYTEEVGESVIIVDRETENTIAKIYSSGNIIPWTPGDEYLEFLFDLREKAGVNVNIHI